MPISKINCGAALVRLRNIRQRIGNAGKSINKKPWPAATRQTAALENEYECIALDMAIACLMDREPGSNIFMLGDDPASMGGA